MKNLHKKIGAGALIALMLGVPVANAAYSGIGSFAGRFIPRDKVYPHGPIVKENQLRVPFLLGSQIAAASDREIMLNNRNIIVGLRDIFKYRVIRVGRNIEVKDVFKPYEGKRIELKDGNAFIKFLMDKGVEDSRNYLFKIGEECFAIQSYEHVAPGKLWWLYLDKWQYGVDEYLKGLIW